MMAKIEHADNDEKEVFWADNIAGDILARKKFHYTDQEIPRFDEYVVKTSASLSGVLHIGRLSDTVRGDSVFTALKDAGVKTRLIWVAEDMDPFRKVPKGVPAHYEQYLGMPVTDVPDVDGCHKSYADHHISKYFEVLDSFVSVKMEKFSMREEYKKGNFNEYIKEILEHVEAIKKIQNRYRTNPLKKNWSPYTPICEQCGKVVTPRVSGYENGKVSYQCKDYEFETTIAKGCGYKGEADPFSGNGKLVWKSEWAAQWKRWKVVSEGAGKEYQVPNSAFWINGEIVERVLKFPMPVPIFYEHVMIDGQKMSASLGNVIYPEDWLQVAPADLIRFFYNKRLMKTRSFSWKEIAQLYDEFDYAGKVYYDKVELENKKEIKHLKRLYQISSFAQPKKPLEMSFSQATTLAQTFEDKNGILGSLRKTGQYQDGMEPDIMDRIEKARAWLEKYAPDEARFSVQEKVPENVGVSDSQRKALRMIAKKLREREWDEKLLFQEIYAVSKELDIPASEIFKAGYRVLLNKERGPKLAPFILSLGERAIKLLERV